MISIALAPPLLTAESLDLAYMRGKGLTVGYEKPLKKVAEEVLVVYPRLKSDLEKTFGWRLNFEPTVLLIKDSETFLKMAGNSIFAAFAVPGRNLVVIDNSKMKTYPFTLDVTLRHELSHLMLHNHIRSGSLPKWLDEGVSQWVSGGIAEIVTDTRRSPLKEAALSGGFIPLRDLARSFPEGKRAVVLAYEEGKSIVEYIDSNYGGDAVIRLLDSLRRGDTIDEAAREVLGAPLDVVEREWHEDLRRRTTWLTYLSNSLYEILFFLAALITFIGFIRLLMKKRAYRDEDDEE